VLCSVNLEVRVMATFYVGYNGCNRCIVIAVHAVRFSTVLV
jgi:hypothetical protein